MLTKRKVSAVREDAPRPASRLRFYGDSFVLNTASGMFYRMSPTADYLLRALDAGARTADFPKLLIQRYQVDPATAMRDTELLLNQFIALGLIDNAAVK